MGKPKVGETYIPWNKHIGFIVPNSISRNKSLSSSAKLLLGRLHQFAGENGKCYPSQKTLAEEIGKDQSTVSDLINELKKKGYIKVNYPTGLDRLTHRHCYYEFIWREEFERYKGKPICAGPYSDLGRPMAEQEFPMTPNKEIPKKENNNNQPPDTKSFSPSIKDKSTESISSIEREEKGFVEGGWHGPWKNIYILPQHLEEFKKKVGESVAMEAINSKSTWIHDNGKRSMVPGKRDKITDFSLSVVKSLEVWIEKGKQLNKQTGGKKHGITTSISEHGGQLIDGVYRELNHPKYHKV